MERQISDKLVSLSYDPLRVPAVHCEHRGEQLQPCAVHPQRQSDGSLRCRKCRLKIRTSTTPQSISLTDSRNADVFVLRTRQCAARCRRAAFSEHQSSCLHRFWSSSEQGSEPGDGFRCNGSVCCGTSAPLASPILVPIWYFFAAFGSLLLWGFCGIIGSLTPSGSLLLAGYTSLIFLDARSVGRLEAPPFFARLRQVQLLASIASLGFVLLVAKN
jgi:hypothetical protein